MSEKARDGQGRWRSKTIAFRISPEENDLLEEFVRLSGLTEQEYVINRVLLLLFRIHAYIRRLETKWSNSAYSRRNRMDAGKSP